MVKKEILKSEEVKLEERNIAVLSYIFFFLPLISGKSKFAFYHANQGLLLLIFMIITNILSAKIPIIGWFVILPLGNLFGLLFFLSGVNNAYRGRRKPIPFIGRFQLLPSIKSI
jgi:uncharacterized membrane protein